MWVGKVDRNHMSEVGYSLYVIMFPEFCCILCDPNDMSYLQTEFAREVEGSVHYIRDEICKELGIP